MNHTEVKTEYKIKVNQVEESRLSQVDFNNLPFGRVFSDHMFTADFVDGKWQNLEINPFGNLNMHPASNVLHYGQAIFEGMKAFKLQDGTPVLTRLDEHAKRFNDSAKRLCMAEVPEELFNEAIEQLVRLDSDWIPTFEGASLYLRPYMLGTDGYLGVKSSNTFKFIIFTCPVGPYYPKPVTLVTAQEYVRAVKGGVGEAKAAGNYAASLLPMRLANEAGYDQVMWMDAFEFKYIQEVGTMNLFFVIDNKVVTPSTDGAILKGITRKSFIEILKNKNIEVEERMISIDEVIETYKRGSLQEIFGSGTAAVVSHVSELTHKGYKMVLPPIEDRKIGNMLKKEITGIRTGLIEDTYGWLKRL